MVNRYWLLVNGYSLLVNGYLLMVNRDSLVRKHFDASAMLRDLW